MRILPLLFCVMCLLLCSCDRTPKAKILLGGNPAWISTDETRRLGEQLMTNRYPQAIIVSEFIDGQTATYWFSTNSTVLPISVVVDRKARKAKFESLRQ
jgi:hypothetical protein